MDAGEQGRYVPRRKKMYPLSLLGALLGLLIGVLLVFNAARQSRLRAETLAQEKPKAIVNLREQRKKTYTTKYRKRGEEVIALLQRMKRTRLDAELRYDWLVKGMDDQHFSSPKGPKLATAIYEALEARERERSGAGEEGAPEDPDYTRIKTRAQELYDQGKLGDAYAKMAEAYSDFKHQHGKEIDEFIERVSNEIDDRWRKDKPAIEKFLASSDLRSANKLLKQARIYGDGQIRHEVEIAFSDVQERLLIQRSSRNDSRDDGEEDEDAADEEDDDSGDEEESDEDEDWDE